MTAKRSRLAQRNGKRRKVKNKLVGILIFLCLLAGMTFLLAKGGKFLEMMNPTPKTNRQSTIKTTTSSQMQPAQTTQSNATSSKDTTNTEWEKQGTPVKIPILMYHAIHVMAPEEAANANLIVDPTTFESHLQALKEAGYRTLTPEEVYKILSENVLPKDQKKVVWLTFDDSLWDFYEIAYPLLKKYDMHATNNVITGTVGNHGNLTLEQMREMKENGMSLQGHTVSHPDLEYSDLQKQEYEQKTAKEYLDSNLGQDTISMAYPGGRHSADTVAITEKAGYKLATTTNNGLASAADGLLTLNRIRILPTTSAQDLLSAIAVQ